MQPTQPSSIPPPRRARVPRRARKHLPILMDDEDADEYTPRSNGLLDDPRSDDDTLADSIAFLSEIH